MQGRPRRFSTRLGSIAFETISDLDLPTLSRARFGRFVAAEGPSGVRQGILRVGWDACQLPELSPSERKAAEGLQQPPRLRSGGLTTTVSVPYSAVRAMALRFPPTSDSLAVPLLRDPRVRAAFQEALAHPAEVLYSGHYFSVEFHDYRTRASRVFVADPVSTLLGRTANNFPQRLFSMHLGSFGAAFMHSACVGLPAGAAVLLGAEGAGKTTASRLAPRGSLFGDDFMLLEGGPGGVTVHATPWGRLGCRPRSGPLGGFFLLEKADRFSLERWTRQEAVAHCWQDRPELHRMGPRFIRTALFDLLCEAARSVPCYRLRFPKDHIDWEAVDRAMEKH